MSYSLILGGTAGLGFELYKLLSRRGPCLVVGRRSIELLSPEDRALQADLDVETSVTELVSNLRSFAINDFIWVSGVLRRAPSLEISADSVLEMIDVNLRHPLLVARSVWQQMAGLKSPSRFTVIASTAGLSDSPRDDEAVYAAVKAAQVSYARAIGKHSSDTLVSLFCPGGMKTEFWDENPIESSVYDSFLDPAKVAAKILSERDAQVDRYRELVIPRGSL